MNAFNWDRMPQTAMSAKAMTQNFHQTCLRLRDDLSFVPQLHRGRTLYHIECRNQRKFYRLEYAEYFFLSLLDGQTSFAAALALTAQKLGGAAPSTSQASQFYLWLLENELGELQQPALLTDNLAGVSSTGGLRSSNGSSTRKTSRANWFNPFWLQIPLGNPDLLLKAILPTTSWIFSPIATLIMLFIMLLGAISLVQNWQQFTDATDQVIAPNNWLWLTLSWLTLKVIHELGHAVCCRRYGGEVTRFGVIFVLLAPLAFVDVTTSWRFASKWSRIHVALAGIYIELIVAALAALALPYTQTEFARQQLHNLIVMASVSTLVFNINPLLRFDGYFVLSDLLEIPNLYDQAQRTVRRHASRFFFGTRSYEARVSAEQMSIGLYGWIALVWRWLVCASMIVAASVMFHGAGIALSIFGIAMWFGKPLWQLACSIRSRFDTQPREVWRAVLISGVLATIGIGVLQLPTPISVTAPGIVEYEDLARLRTPTGGFVRKVLVSDGDDVESGQLLLQLENHEVAREYNDLQLQIEIVQHTRQAATDAHDIAAMQVAESRLGWLSNQFAEAQRRYEALEVRAPVDGKVVSRGLDKLQDTFVAEGKELLAIGREGAKEVMISVDHRDFDSVISQVGQQVAIRLGSQPTVSGVLKRLEPRASKELLNAALSASEGGQIEVVETQQDDKTSLLQTEPRFRGIVTLADSVAADSLHVGQRAAIKIGHRQETIAESFQRIVTNWIRDKINETLPTNR